MKTIRGREVSKPFHAKMQVAFDTIMAHLRKQNKRSYQDDGSMCMYRTEEGLQCAIGCLIPEELYSIKIEGQRARNVFNDRPAIYESIFGKDVSFDEEITGMDLLDGMQSVHDHKGYPERGWISAGHDVGKAFQLTTRGR